MADRKNAESKPSTSTASFADVTKEIARRNEEAQKAARTRRAAREREQIATRRRWEQL